MDNATIPSLLEPLLEPPTWLHGETLRWSFHQEASRSMWESGWRWDLQNVFYAATELPAMYLFLFGARHRTRAMMLCSALSVVGMLGGLFWHFRDEGFDDSFFMQITILPALAYVVQELWWEWNNLGHVYPMRYVIALFLIIMVCDSQKPHYPRQSGFHAFHTVVHFLLPAVFVALKSCMSEETAGTTEKGKKVA